MSTGLPDANGGPPRTFERLVKPLTSGGLRDVALFSSEVYCYKFAREVWLAVVHTGVPASSSRWQHMRIQSAPN